MKVGLAYKRSMGNIPEGLVFDFLEVAPENWIGIDTKRFAKLREDYQIVLHGLSLSIGSVDTLDLEYINKIKQFMDDYELELYTEHLSFCSFNGHMYDLMPLPFTDEAVDHVVNRVKIVQDILNRRMALENISFYGNIDGQMSEAEFINQITNKSGCGLMLDVNNIFVNSVNHKNYTPKEFVEDISADVLYYHNAGHYWEREDLIIDSHGANITNDSLQLLDIAYKKFGTAPTTLERDFNIPPLNELNQEGKCILEIINKH